MAIIQILQYPDPRLSKIATPVDAITSEINQMIDDMFETHYAADNCAALAHSQLNFPEPKRITVIDFSEQKNNPLCLVNPEIIDKSGETYLEEGCMSVRGGFVSKVKRAERIHVTSLDRHGRPQEFHADGFLAKCIQHELDHLNGILFLDRINDFKRRQMDKKIKKYFR
jgi:peptide deformylase